MQVLIRKTLGVSIMNQYEFTYEIPDDITNHVIRFLQMNGEDALAKALVSCRIEYEDLGLAYYAGMKGDNWNKKALDITIEGPEKQIDILKARERLLREKMYDGALFSYKGDFLDYLQLEDMGVFTTHGYDPGVPEEKLDELRRFGASLK